MLGIHPSTFDMLSEVVPSELNPLNTLNSILILFALLKTDQLQKSFETFRGARY